MVKTSLIIFTTFTTVLSVGYSPGESTVSQYQETTVHQAVVQFPIYK